MVAYFEVVVFLFTNLFMFEVIDQSKRGDQRGCLIGKKKLLFQRGFFHESFQEISYEINRVIPIKDLFVHLNPLYTNRVPNSGKF